MLEEISEAEIKEVLSFMTGIPVSEVTESEKHKFLNIDKKLNRRIIGQENAIKKHLKCNSTIKSRIKEPK